jgi:hypothetical protein
VILSTTPQTKHTKVRTMYKNNKETLPISLLQEQPVFYAGGYKFYGSVLSFILCLNFTNTKLLYFSIDNARVKSLNSLKMNMRSIHLKLMRGESKVT